jgi:dTDP-4-dehydrorhamnose 3,5-epimerase-like enzyme
MAAIIKLPEFSDLRGRLTVIDNIEKLIPFAVKRIFYIYDVDDSVRGGHRHHTTRQAAVCIKGKCIVSNNNGIEKKDFLLDSPSKCLILETEDWHQMHQFTPDAILLVFASTVFTPEDYIYEPYSD